MLGKSLGLAKEHLAEELGLVPKQYAEKSPKKAMFPTTDAILDGYAEKRAFWITGITQEAILKDARNFIFQYAKEHPGMSEAGIGFEEGLYGSLLKWLPVNDKLGRPINPAFRSETIARTNIMDMYNHARGTIMMGPELAGWVKGFRYSSIIDASTTAVCRHLNGKIFTPQTINGFNPPNHFNCRSVLLPVTQLDKGWKEEMAKQGEITLKPAEGFSSGFLLPPEVPPGKVPIEGGPLPGAKPAKPPEPEKKAPEPPKLVQVDPAEVMPDWGLLSPEAKALVHAKAIAEWPNGVFPAEFPAVLEKMNQWALDWMKKVTGTTPVISGRNVGRELHPDQHPSEVKIKAVDWKKQLPGYEGFSPAMKKKISDWTWGVGELPPADVPKWIGILSKKVAGWEAKAAPAAPVAAQVAPAKLVKETFVKIDFKSIQYTRKWNDSPHPPLEMKLAALKKSTQKVIMDVLKEKFPSGYYPASQVDTINDAVKQALEQAYSKFYKAKNGIGVELSDVKFDWKMTKKKMTVEPKVPKVPAVEVPPVPEPVPSPVVPPPVPAGPPPKLGEIHGVEILKAENVLGTKLSEAKGSNPGGMYRGVDGVERYVKFYQDPVQAYNEAVANNIYRALGLEVPKSMIFEHNGKWAFASEMMSGVQGTVGKVGLSPAVAQKILHGYSADVLTANWDAVGTGLDNVVVLTNGKIVRVDQGGSLLFRAKAGRKSVSFLEDVTEIQGFADSMKNPHYAKVFQKAGIFNGADLGVEANRQLAQIYQLRQATNNFADLVPEVPGVPAADRQAILSMLRKRADFLETDFRKMVHDFLNPPPPPPPVEMTGRNAPVDPIVNNVMAAVEKRISRIKPDMGNAHGAYAEPLSPGAVAKLFRESLAEVMGENFATNFQNMRAELWGGWKQSAQCSQANMAKYLAEKAGIAGRTTFTSQYINNSQTRRQDFISNHEQKIKKYAQKYGQDVVDRYALLEYHMTQRLLRHVYGDGPLPTIYRGVSRGWFDDNKVPIPSGVVSGSWQKIKVHQNSVSGFSTSPSLSFGGGYKFRVVPKREDIFTTHFLVKGAQRYHSEAEWWYLSSGPSDFEITKM